MSETLRTVLGVAAAAAAAVSFAGASVLQKRATHRVGERPAGRPRLFLDLLRRPGWRWSMVLTAVAFALQVAALRAVPLLIVQPVLVTGLLWYVVLAAVVARRRPDATLAAGVALCLAGLCGFLVLARPSGAAGEGLSAVWTALPLGGAVAGAVAGCLIVSAVVARRWRALPRALAAGVCYGTTAALIRSLSHYFGQGIPGLLGHWQLYAIVAVGPLGLLLSQNALQAGRLGAPALAIITITDPLVAITIGLVWLDERVRLDLGYALGELASLIVLAAAVFLVAGRAPHVDARAE